MIAIANDNVALTINMSSVVDNKRILGTLAVLLAVVVGGSMAFVSSFAAIYPLSGYWIVLTIVVVLDMTHPERMIIRSLQRVAGSVIGAALGIAIVSLMANMQHLSVVSRLFQWSCITLVALLTGVACRLIPYHKYVFSLILFTVAIAIYPPNINSAISWMVSVCAGAVIALLAIVIAHVPPASQTVLNLYAQVIVSSIYFVEFAIAAPVRAGTAPPSKRPASKIIHRITTDLAVAHECLGHYNQLNRWFCLSSKTVTDLQRLSSSAHAVYHSCHNLFLTFRIGGTSELFSLTTFTDIYGYDMLRLKEILSDLSSDLVDMHQSISKDTLHNTTTNFTHAFNLMERIITNSRLDQATRNDQQIQWGVVSFLTATTPVILQLFDYTSILMQTQRYEGHRLPEEVRSRLVEIIKNG